VAIHHRPRHVVRSRLSSEFPNLTKADWLVRSPFDDSYQCIAWAAGRTDRSWWPNRDYYWPAGLPTVDPPEIATVADFSLGFETLGYEKCDSSAFEIGYQKLAIYANEVGVTHMARQHFLGRGWLSKLGDLEDILHRELEDVEGSTSALAGQYGKVVQILRRNWWTAVRYGLFRTWWAGFRFWVLRVKARLGFVKFTTP
jgi:hypothetical protein